MRKLIVLLLLLALCGCSGNQVLETVTDTDLAPVMAQVRELEVTLPEEAAAYTSGGGSDKVYFCDGYTVVIQTMDGGDLNRTLRQVSGFEKEALSVMETRQQDHMRYDLAWSAAGEEGEQVCRAAVLDDGYYHYAVTVMADYEQAGMLQESWGKVLDSVKLSRID